MLRQGAREESVSPFGLGRNRHYLVRCISIFTTYKHTGLALCGVHGVCMHIYLTVFRGSCQNVPNNA